MAGITCMKIGIGYYQGIEDRNGGSHEFRLIFDQAVSINTETRLASLHTSRIDILLVVNGKENFESWTKFEALKARAKKVIFVLTDYGFIEDNKRYIQEADMILWQAPMRGELFGVPAQYGYVPQLFYTEQKLAPYRNQFCLFGGNIAGREAEVKKMLLRDDGLFCRNIVALYKDVSGFDCRVPYNQYIQMLRACSSMYCSGRKAGKEVGWVTPRYVEAISAGCYPIKINDYDNKGYFGFEALRAKTRSRLDYAIVRAMYREPELDEEMKKEQERFKEESKLFKKILIEELNKV